MGMLMSEPSIEFTECRLDLADVPVGLRPIHDYWQDRRANARMPARADVDPVDFGRMLGKVSLIEVNSSVPRFVFRVVGTRFGYRRGGARDGEDVALMRPRNYADRVINQFEEACALAAPTLYRNTLAFGDVRYTYERLLLPLGADRHTPDRLMLCVLMDEALQTELWRRWADADKRVSHAGA